MILRDTVLVSILVSTLRPGERLCHEVFCGDASAKGKNGQVNPFHASALG